MGNFCSLSPEEESLAIEQIKYLQSELCSIQSSFLGVISIPLGVYGLIIYYAFHLEKEYSCILFVLIPFLFSLSLYNILKYTIRMMGLDAYISYLENLINYTHKKTLFRWQSYLIYANGFSVIGTFAQIPCFFALVVFFGYKFAESIQLVDLPNYCKIILVFLLIFQVIGLLYMLFLCASQYGAIRYWCKNIPIEFSDIPPDNFHTECPRFIFSVYQNHKDSPIFSYVISVYHSTMKFLFPSEKSHKGTRQECCKQETSANEKDEAGD